MPRKKASHTKRLYDLLDQLRPAIAKLDDEIAAVAVQMAALEKKGLIYASPFWRKDAQGADRYLYLIYPSRKGEKRQRDYVGTNPDDIRVKLDAIERANEYDVLDAQQKKLKARLDPAETALAEAAASLAGRFRHW